MFLFKMFFKIYIFYYICKRYSDENIEGSIEFVLGEYGFK